MRVCVCVCVCNKISAYCVYLSVGWESRPGAFFFFLASPSADDLPFVYNALPGYSLWFRPGPHVILSQFLLCGAAAKNSTARPGSTASLHKLWGGGERGRGTPQRGESEGRRRRDPTVTLQTPLATSALKPLLFFTKVPAQKSTPAFPPFFFAEIHFDWHMVWAGKRYSTSDSFAQ